MAKKKSLLDEGEKLAKGLNAMQRECEEHGGTFIWGSNGTMCIEPPSSR